ncbi:MAG: VCBS repeat-containing protein [Bryobacteraceae bacterium]
MQVRFTNFLLRLIAVFFATLITAYAQTSPFSFFARHDILAGGDGAPPAALGVADFNGDGIMDIAMVDPGGVMVVMLGTGNLTYTSTFYEPPAGLGQLETIVIGDFNNDGYPDIAVGGFLSGVGVYINNGDGTFSGPATYGTDETTFGLATADVDHDGNLDLIGQGFVLLGIGNGAFEVAAPLVQPSTRPAGTVRPGTAPTATSVIGGPVAVADLNGDGNIDVAYVGDDGGGVQIFLGNGNGTFRAPPRGSTCNFAGFQVAIGDFNNDGIPDLAFTGNGQVGVCLGNGNGTFGEARMFTIPGGFPGQSILAYDLNGDGNIDIATVDLNRGGEGDIALASPMGVLYGNGKGEFKPAVVYEVIFPFGIAEGDLNGDGFPDLVVAGGEETDPLIFAFLGSSSGKLQAAPEFSAGVTTTEGFAFGDFNGDGRVDLAVTGSGSSNVSILLGNGTGGFLAPTTFDTGPTPIGVVAGDFNRDGKLDLAVCNEGLDNVSILLGNGDGTFEPATNFGAGQSPIYVVTGDFNGDGKLDLAVTNAAGNNVSILLGKGDGTFGAPTNFATGETPEFIAVGDLNGDGKLDLAVANSANGTGTVSVLFGKGDGTFQPAVSLATTGTESAGIAIADFNGDSKPDIVVANFGSATVSVFLGNGAGAFGNAISSPVVAGFVSAPFALATGDFNGDGKTDVAVIAYQLQDVALLPGLGNGSFGPATLFGADALPFAIAAVPLVKGKPKDLVVVNEERNLVSVLQNTGK